MRWTDVNWYLKIIKMRHSPGWKILCQLKLLSKHSWSSYHAGKKRVATPTPLNSSIFPLLEDEVHSPEKQTPQILTKWQQWIVWANQYINPMKISGICISKVLYFVWSTSHWKRIIDRKRTCNSRSRTRQNSGWYIYW